MNKVLHVLIVEDSEDDALLLLVELRHGGYEPAFERVDTAEQLLSALHAKSWDIVISDYIMPQFNGLEALKIIRESDPDLPFIIVSGKIGEDTAVNAMKAGANDYLIKGNVSRLIPAIERELHEAEIRRKRKEAEDALVKSERRYKRLVDAVTDYIYTVRLRDGEVIRTSHGPGCLAVTGYSQEEYGENPLLWYTMIVEEDRDQVMTVADKLKSGIDIPSLEHRIIHKDGTIHWVQNTVVPRYNEHGELIAYDGLISDITDRKRAEASLRLQSAALEAAANAIVITDQQGKLIWVNPAFTELTGYTQEEVTQKTMSFLKSGRHEDSYYQALWGTITCGKVWHGETINRRKDGSLYTEEQTITPVMDEKGIINHYVAIKQDITIRKLTENALLKNTRMVREMEIAQQIQNSLLPASPPDVPGIECAGQCVPATHVGGDYYDFFLHGNDTLDIVIADVSGHSVGAALLMAETRSVLRTLVNPCNSPEKILSSINTLLHDDLSRAELFISIFYARYDTSNRMLSFSNAGHTPPILFRPNNGSFTQLDTDGLVAGVFKEVSFEEKRIQLEPGELLFLYTDGIIEAEDKSGELFGEDRLCRILAEHHTESASKIISAVLDKVGRYTGSTVFDDDISMVVLKIV
jgi:sigma-B regulation protein RsbU (phosphoserine phosphatase)